LKKQAETISANVLSSEAVEVFVFHTASWAKSSVKGAVKDVAHCAQVLLAFLVEFHDFNSFWVHNYFTPIV